MNGKELISKLSLNSKLAASAILLGVIAFVIGNPGVNTEAKINAKDLAVIVEKEIDQISVENLADWIIKGKSDYRLVDLRTEKEYADYAIPSSENIQITNLLEGDLLRNQKILLYSDGGTHSAQAWFLLKAKGFKNVYMVKGGLEEWKNKILFPKLPADFTTEQKSEFDKMAEVSKYFGGSPQAGTGDTVVENAPALPKLTAPMGVAGGGTKKKKREGC